MRRCQRMSSGSERKKVDVGRMQERENYARTCVGAFARSRAHEPSADACRRYYLRALRRATYVNLDFVSRERCGELARRIFALLGPLPNWFVCF